MNPDMRWLVVLCCLLLSSTGCVMKEQYEAEKNRALNFQRLLAQEEKRTGELDTEVKRLKRDVPDLEARNRELMAQLQGFREEMARVQEENSDLREAAALRAREELTRALESKGKPTRKAAPKAPMPKSEDLSAGAPTEPSGDSIANAELKLPMYHEVKPGDTLFRLARQYGVHVSQLKDWNHLNDTVIEVGQKLIVGYE